MSIHKSVQARIERMQRGTPFAINGFYTLGSITSVQKALSRLTKEGVIVRVSKGFYSRPKPLESLPSVKVTASAEQVAQCWAKEHHYELVPQGLEAAYRLGFQTQAPMKSIYWSSGPSRTFKVGNQMVIIRHTGKQKLHWGNQPEGTLLRGLLATSPESIELSELSNAFKRISLSPEKTKKTVQKLRHLPQLHAWANKLHEFELAIAS